MEPQWGCYNSRKETQNEIVVKNTAGEDIYNSVKYQQRSRTCLEFICRNGHAWLEDLHFQGARQVWMYEGDLWDVIKQVIEGNPMTVWPQGDENRQLNVTQSLLEGVWVFMTWEAHEHLIEVYRRLGDESLAERDFGQSVNARENHDWKPTPACLLKEIYKAFMEHGQGELWNSTGYGVKNVSIDMKSCYSASFKGEGKAKSYYKRFGHPTQRISNQ